MAYIFFMSLILIGQETAFLGVLSHLKFPMINYNNVEQTFEENGPPILAFANSQLPTGESTDGLFTLYKSLYE